jgi:hypothetical protein
MMHYPPFPARSEARSALPDAPVVVERKSRLRLRLPRFRPLRWQRLLESVRPARIIGARS